MYYNNDSANGASDTNDHHPQIKPSHSGNRAQQERKRKEDRRAANPLNENFKSVAGNTDH